MERADIIKQLDDIFTNVLDEDAVALTESTTADEVEGWDSLSHIQLIVAIEKHFKIKFTSREILSWQNVGEMIDSILAKA
jgi:acyl carrier protein